MNRQQSAPHQHRLYVILTLRKRCIEQRHDQKLRQFSNVAPRQEHLEISRLVDRCRRLPPNADCGADAKDQSSMHRVLLIDDDAELTGMLSQYLTSEGFECHVALSGKDGMQAAAQADFDTIILDIMLP